MATEQEKAMREFAEAIDYGLQMMYGKKMGFFLSVFEFDDKPGAPGHADYISNANREDIIVAMRETADRFEKGETIPVTKGSA